jgi:methylglutaconyl-CoA hydratase
MTAYISTQKTDHVFYITLNRPEKRNAMHGDMVRELSLALKEAVSDTQVRVVVLQGKGTCFCAGGDIAWMKKMVECGGDENDRDAMQLGECLYQLYTMPIPTIALAHGVTLGGGVGLLCACDIVLADTEASFGFSEGKIGLAPSTISPYVISAIGERYARYFFLTGEIFSSDYAVQIGLVHAVMHVDELLDQTEYLIKLILENGQHALRESKAILNTVCHQRITTDLVHATATHLAKLRSSPEAKEGCAAFLEKRRPHWRQ